MTLRILFKTDQTGPKFRHGMERFAERVGIAAVRTLNEAGHIIETRGRRDIKGAGKFGRRWTEGLTARTQIHQDEVRLQVTHAVPYFNIFQKGGIIRGRPLLWIPLSFAGVPKGVRARDYPGGLFRVNRKSGKAPLLLSRTDRKPKYFGKKSVRIPKKFHVIEICREVARDLRAIYRKHFKATGG